jgi:hypothetical protein
MDRADSGSSYAHTLDTLCIELVSGRSVRLEGGGDFQLRTPQARAIFEWYRQNPGKWAKNTNKEDVETLADRLDNVAPILKPACIPAVGQGRTLHLRSMRTHCFGGIQRYRRVGQLGSDFFFQFDRPLLLLEGANGAGKTSLLSALAWALTGYAYRSQAPPERPDRPILIQRTSANHDTAAPVCYLASPIASLPSSADLDVLGSKPLPADTWVELSFVDEEGNDAGTVCRSIQRVTRSAVVMTDPDFATLGLDPIALEVGTRMPGLVPHIRLGISSDLGKAVAALLGLKPLQDLAAHAARSQTRLRRELVKDRESEIERLDDAFFRANQALACLIADHPGLEPRPPLDRPEPRPDARDEGTLAALAKHFEELQVEMLARARSMLGDSFNYQDRVARQDLIDSIGPAVGLVDAIHLRSLPSAARLSGLARLSEQQLAAVETLLTRLSGEAHALAAASVQPAIAARLRLYARVASWLKESSELPDVDTCPLCATALAGKTDAVTGRAIAGHLHDCLDTNEEYLEKSLATWEEGALAKLRGGLPESLLLEVDRDLPDRPADLIATALCDELFASRFLQGSLAAMRQTAESLCQSALRELPPFEEPVAPSLPDCFGARGQQIAQALRRVGRAIAFAHWRQRYEKECREAFARIVGRPGSDETADTGVFPLAKRLAALDRLVKNAAPLAEALAHVTAMRGVLTERREKEKRIVLYRRTAEALEELVGLKELVERQVACLMGRLAEAVRSWMEILYAPAFEDAPAVTNPEVETDGSLGFDAAVGEIRVPAQHASNESGLRAALLAFLFAFWQYLHTRRGGLSLLLLDDIQELFDPPNRRRIARGIAKLAAQGARLVVTTIDPQFARIVADAAIQEIGSAHLDHRRIEPPSATQPCIVLAVPCTPSS